MTMLETAKQICIQAHDGQFRRNGRPYAIHPIAVAELLNSEVEKIVGYLHDVLEDTDWKMLNIMDKLYEADDAKSYVIVDVRYALDILTKEKHEAYKDYIKRCAKDKIARNVKMADIIHNMSDDPSDHAKEKYLKAYKHFLNWI